MAGGSLGEASRPIAGSGPIAGSPADSGAENGWQNRPTADDLGPGKGLGRPRIRALLGGRPAQDGAGKGIRIGRGKGRHASRENLSLVRSALPHDRLTQQLTGVQAPAGPSHRIPQPTRSPTRKPAHAVLEGLSRVLRESEGLGI
jgi:hypothetical protein